MTLEKEVPETFILPALEEFVIETANGDGEFLRIDAGNNVSSSKLNAKGCIEESIVEEFTENIELFWSFPVAGRSAILKDGITKVLSST